MSTVKIVSTSTGTRKVADISLSATALGSPTNFFSSSAFKEHSLEWKYKNCQPSQWCQQFEHVTSLLALFHVQRNTFLSCWSIFLAAASASSTLLMNKYHWLVIELVYEDIIIILVSGSLSSVGDQRTRIIIKLASHAQPSAFSARSPPCIIIFIIFTTMIMTTMGCWQIVNDNVFKQFFLPQNLGNRFHHIDNTLNRIQCGLWNYENQKSSEF